MALTLTGVSFSKDVQTGTDLPPAQIQPDSGSGNSFETTMRRAAGQSGAKQRTETRTSGEKQSKKNISTDKNGNVEDDVAQDSDDADRTVTENADAAETLMAAIVMAQPAETGQKAQAAVSDSADAIQPVAETAGQSSVRSIAAQMQQSPADAIQPAAEMEEQSSVQAAAAQIQQNAADSAVAQIQQNAAGAAAAQTQQNAADAIQPDAETVQQSTVQSDVTQMQQSAAQSATAQTQQNPADVSAAAEQVAYVPAAAAAQEAQTTADGLSRPEDSTAAASAADENQASDTGGTARTQGGSFVETVSDQLRKTGEQIRTELNKKTADTPVQTASDAMKDARTADDSVQQGPVLEKAAVTAAVQADTGSSAGGGAPNSNGEASAGDKTKLAPDNSVGVDAPNLQGSAFTSQLESLSSIELEELSNAVDTAIEQMSDDLASVTSEDQTVKIRLEPEKLGSLAITLTAGDGGITAKIRADNAQAAVLLSSEVEKIVASLQDKGLQVKNVDVGYGQLGGQAGGGGQQNSGAQNQYQNRETYVVPDFGLYAAGAQSEAISSYEDSPGAYAREDGLGESVECTV